MQPQNNFQPPQPNNQPQPLTSPQTFAPTVITPTVYAASATSGSASSGYKAPDLSVPTPPPALNQPSDSHKQGFLRPAVKALAVLLIVGGLAGGGFAANGGLKTYSQNHAKTTAVSFIGFLNTNNDAAAYHASSSNLRNAQTEAQFSSNLGDLSAKNPKFSNQQLQVKGDKAVYTATVDGLPPTDTGRTDGVFTIALVKHGLASWQVDSVQVQ